MVFTVSLVLLHALIMEPMTEAQFTNWISCTVYAFAVMLFGIDLILFAVVALVLKRSQGVFDKRKCCSIFNLLVYWPLGKWKY